jgi:hypothetical protein
LKSTAVSFLLLLTITFIFFTNISNVQGQFDNVEVLSYRWYVSSIGTLIVVGELQNVGSGIIEYVNLVGVAYSTEGAEAESITSPFSRQLHPQQKAPFLMYFFPEYSYYGDYNWISRGINYINFTATSAYETENYQYPDLEITTQSGYINSNGIYTVTGKVRNTGDQATGKVWVVATFYNSTGDVIMVDFSDYLSPDQLQPNDTAGFSISTTAAIPELENEFKALANDVTDYALVVQTQGPLIPEFPSWAIIPLLLLATLIVAIYRKKLQKTQIINYI